MKIPSVYFSLLISLIFAGCDDSGGECALVEAMAGYPKSFDRSLEDIEYYFRFEYDFDDSGTLLEIRQYRIEDDYLISTQTDFEIDPDYSLGPNQMDGLFYFPNGSDSIFRQFVEMKSGNGVREGIQRIDDAEQQVFTSRNYFDSHPNVLKRPEYRYYSGRQSVAGLNSKNNLIAYADLSGSNLVLDYIFIFDIQGRLIRSQIPSGYTIDYKYNCP